MLAQKGLDLAIRRGDVDEVAGTYIFMTWSARERHSVSMLLLLLLLLLLLQLSLSESAAGRGGLTSVSMRRLGELMVADGGCVGLGSGRDCNSGLRQRGVRQD